MSKLTDSFKALAQAMLGTSEDIPGDSLADVVDYLAENYTAPSDGADGVDGASVTAIALVTDVGGAVTGGTATLSDESTVEITVTSGT